VAGIFPDRRISGGAVCAELRGPSRRSSFGGVILHCLQRDAASWSGEQEKWSPEAVVGADWRVVGLREGAT